jgi:hypothetical protein
LLKIASRIDSFIAEAGPISGLLYPALTPCRLLYRDSVLEFKSSRINKTQLKALNSVGFREEMAINIHIVVVPSENEPKQIMMTIHLGLLAVIYLLIVKLTARNKLIHRNKE